MLVWLNETGSMEFTGKINTTIKKLCDANFLISSVVINIYIKYREILKRHKLTAVIDDRTFKKKVRV